MGAETYEGRVAYSDGWHWTVVEDEASREHALTIANANVTRAQKIGGGEALVAAEAELADVQQRRFETIGEKLYLDEDGSYRLASDADQSWHDRKHEQFAAIIPNLSKEDIDRLRQILDAQEQEQ